jgi:hypothetical protein
MQSETHKNSTLVLHVVEQVTCTRVPLSTQLTSSGSKRFSDPTEISLKSAIICSVVVAPMSDVSNTFSNLFSVSSSDVPFPNALLRSPKNFSLLAVCIQVSYCNKRAKPTCVYMQGDAQYMINHYCVYRDFRYQFDKDNLGSRQRHLLCITARFLQGQH